MSVVASKDLERARHDQVVTGSHVGQPLVSVLMAVYNDGNEAGGAIESILRQTYTNFEFIIVNDGSSDDTAMHLARFRDERIRICTRDHAGLTVSLNRGLAEARGKYVARIDVGDEAVPERLARQVAFLESHPDVVLLGSLWRGISPTGGQNVDGHPPSDDLTIRWRLLFNNVCGHCCLMLRRAELCAIGGYDEQVRHAQDYDLQARMAAVGRLANVPEFLMNARLDETAATERPKWPTQQAFVEAVSLRQLRGLLGAKIDAAHRNAAWRLISVTDRLSSEEILLAVRVILSAAHTFRRQWGEGADEPLGRERTIYAERLLVCSRARDRLHACRLLWAAFRLAPTACLRRETGTLALTALFGPWRAGRIAELLLRKQRSGGGKE